MKLKVLEPDTIKMELTMSMSLKDWKALREQLVREWPSSSLSLEITDMVSQAEKWFYPK